MAERLGGESDSRAAARAVALAGELATQLRHLKGAGPKIRQLLSMVQLDPPADGERSAPALGALPEGARAVAFKDVRRVIEQDLDERVGRLFDDFDQEPFALSSLGQVHRAYTSDGHQVAVKVQHQGRAEAVEADLRNVGVMAPILRRIAPGVDADALLGEIRERISDELDYELEAQQQRRVERWFRGHPHVRLPRVHTQLCARRVLVTEYIDGLPAAQTQLSEAERDRIGEIAFRFYFGLAWRDGVVVGDPHPDNCIVCPDGRLCVLDFGLVRDLPADYLRGEHEILRALADDAAQRVHDGLSSLGYLRQPDAFDAAALDQCLSTAGEWLLTAGVRRIDPEYVTRTLELGYPPRSPYFPLMRRMNIPAPTLLLRRMELQVLALLGDLHAAADWAAIADEHHSGKPPSTEPGRDDLAFHEPRRQR
jgi:predicted unusual protein kinase regulating ubiquinone biosynthesis (AarF/ABC1/UbiB family)